MEFALLLVMRLKTRKSKKTKQENNWNGGCHQEMANGLVS